MSTSTMLDGASKYLNNLLLARGLLPDGKPIDFAQLAGNANANTNTHIDLASTQPDSSSSITRNKSVTSIINLIHDLVLRRDRDAEKHEALASTIHALRAEEAQRLLDLQKLQDRAAQLTADLSTSEARQRNLALHAKKAQADVKDFREQNLKMKSTLDQVRAKCVNDVRKRDVEVERLRGLLNGLNGRGGGAGRNHSKQQQLIAAGMGGRGREGREVLNGKKDSEGTSEWTLEHETNGFLTAVVNETSTENVALRKIVGDSLGYLRTLTGLDEQEDHKELKEAEAIANAKPIGIPGQYRDDRNGNGNDNSESSGSALSESLTPVQDLASSMSEVLSHCQSILRDPSFVPIEEVHVRDEEILKLRRGWEKMADRWKEAVTMMSQWRQKMIGDTQQDPYDQSARAMDEALFNAEGLSGIAAFGRSIAVRPNGRPVLDPVEEEELTSMLIEHHHQSRIMANQSAISDEAEVEDVKHQLEQHPSLSLNGESVLEPDGHGTPRANSFLIYADNNDNDDADIATTGYALADPSKLQITASPARRGIKLQAPTLSLPSKPRPPLSDTNANPKKRKSSNSACSSDPRKRRSVSPAHLLPPPASEISTTSSTVNQSSSAQDSFASDSIDPLQAIDSDTDNDEDDDIDLFLPDASDKRGEKTTSKIPRMTVAQKLAAVEAEATEATEVIRMRQATTYDSADRRAKDRARKSKSKVPSTVDASRDGSKSSSVKKSGKGTEKHSGGGNGGIVEGGSGSRQTLKRARDRRRSTLTPRELGALMGQ